MIRYISDKRFLETLDKVSMTLDFKRVKDDKELRELFNLFDNNNSRIEKQIGFYIPVSYKSEVITTSHIGNIETGDIFIIKGEEKHYIVVVEEVNSVKEDDDYGI